MLLVVLGGVLAAAITLTCSPGLYLLTAAAIIGLIGAALAQHAQPVPQSEPGDEAVVHQFTDDDTPPFGIAMSQEEEAR